jgi:hypothetical protein
MFRLIYIDNADVVAVYATHAEALDHLRRFVEEHPDLVDEIGVQEVDTAGSPVGAMTIGLEVADQQLTL